ncbi:uncharacterized protein LOC127289445 [Leptopilina boulardi]|uniref:uncharacterized protein LOC127289445 n=1 Tax=Leptopilina boulardi TaxID=63433 RepID=UPI0021F50767|nr:uncharacterized protein LOC127289445 [Leptopilina boulardi]
MEKQLRYKGKFIKQSVLTKKTSFLAQMTRGKQLCDELNNVKDVDVNKVTEICPGRRIVELDVIAKNLKCIKCKEAIFLNDIQSEKCFGLNSVLTIRCQKCLTETSVPTGKFHKTLESHSHSDVNTKAVLGAVHSGIGNTALNKVLACLNIPSISTNLYKRYEREVGPALEKIAKDSCKQAATEERQLVINNVDQLCEDL